MKEKNCRGRMQSEWKWDSERGDREQTEGIRESKLKVGEYQCGHLLCKLPAKETHLERWLSPLVINNVTKYFRRPESISETYI